MDALAGFSVFVAAFSRGGDLTAGRLVSPPWILDQRRHSAFRTIRGGTFLGLFSWAVDGLQLLSLGYQDRICNRELNAFFFVFNRLNMAFPNLMTDFHHGALQIQHFLFRSNQRPTFENKPLFCLTRRLPPPENQKLNTIH